MKWIDLPPIWLALHVGVAWAIAPHLPWSVTAPWVVTVGTWLIACGLGIMAVAAITMWRAKTTVLPHLEAQQLVDFGVFARSRNPIYLADAVVLAGVILRAGSPVLLILVPIFMAVIRRRFIEPEEARLERKFGQRFQAYCGRTRRWM